MQSGFRASPIRQRDLAERRYPGRDRPDSDPEWNEAIDLGYDPMEIEDVLDDHTKRWEKFRKA